MSRKTQTVRTALQVILLCVASVPAFASDVTDTELMKAATDLGHQYDSNYAAKNPTAMAALYADDGVLVSPAGPIVKGRDALVEYYKKRFASGALGHHINVREVHVQGNGGYSIATFSVTVPQESGKLREEQGSIVAVYQRDPDGWHMRLVEPSVPESSGK